MYGELFEGHLLFQIAESFQRSDFLQIVRIMCIIWALGLHRPDISRVVSHSNRLEKRCLRAYVGFFGFFVFLLLPEKAFSPRHVYKAWFTVAVKPGEAKLRAKDWIVFTGPRVLACPAYGEEERDKTTRLRRSRIRAGQWWLPVPTCRRHDPLGRCSTCRCRDGRGSGTGRRGRAWCSGSRTGRRYRRTSARFEQARSAPSTRKAGEHPSGA